MPSEPPPTRRLAVAVTAAVASTTIAIGVTSASLLGWLRPSATPASEAVPAAPAAPAPSPVIFVPVTPAPLEVDGEPVARVQLAAHERDHHHEHELKREHHEDHDDDDD